MIQQSLQEQFFSQGRCFGCGPLNPNGLKIRSFPKDDTVICEWKPEEFHEAYPGILNGGIVGTLLDCHSNWTAAYHLMKRNSSDHPPCTVTAEFSVKLLRPTPTQNSLQLIARVTESKENRATVEADLIVENQCCAKFRGVFVAVKPDHPAYHRW